eukprot:2702326-Pleurochrysis_carterae.AAC.1
MDSAVRRHSGESDCGSGGGRHELLELERAVVGEEQLAQRRVESGAQPRVGRDLKGREGRAGSGRSRGDRLKRLGGESVERSRASGSVERLV